MEDKSTNKSKLINRWFFFLFVNAGFYSENLEKYIDISSEQFDLMAAITDLNASDEKRNKAVELGIFPEEAFKPEFTGKNAQIQSMISSQTKEGAYTRLFLEKFFDDRFKEKLAEEHFDMSILEHKDFDLIQKYLDLIGADWNFASFTNRRSVDNRKERLSNPFSAYKVYGQGEYSKLLIGWDNRSSIRTQEKLTPELLLSKGMNSCLELIEEYPQLTKKLHAIQKEMDGILEIDGENGDLSEKRKKKRSGIYDDITNIVNAITWCLQSYNNYYPYHLSSIVTSENDQTKETLQEYIIRKSKSELIGGRKKRRLHESSDDGNISDYYEKREIELINMLIAKEKKLKAEDIEDMSVRQKIEYLAKQEIGEKIKNKAQKELWDKVFFGKYQKQYPDSYETLLREKHKDACKDENSHEISANVETGDEYEEGIQIVNNLYDEKLNPQQGTACEKYKADQFLIDSIYERFNHTDQGDEEDKEIEFRNIFIAEIHHCLENTKFRLNCGNPDMSSNHKHYMANSIYDVTRKESAEFIRKDNPKIVLPSCLTIKGTETLLQDFNEITDEDLEKRFNVPEVLIDYVKLLFLLETLRHTKSTHPWQSFYSEYSKVVYNRTPGTRDKEKEPFIKNMEKIYKDFKETKGGLLCR